MSDGQGRQEVGEGEALAQEPRQVPPEEPAPAQAEEGLTAPLIRKAQAPDLPAVLRLLGDLSAPGEPGLDPERAERTFARMVEYPDYAVYVAEEDGAVVGTFALLVMDNLGHGGAPAGVVENVVVEATHRGRGIGGAMMRFAMARCADAGCYKLVLSSNLRREAAHRFYEDLGFAQHGLSFSVPTARKGHP